MNDLHVDIYQYCSDHFAYRYVTFDARVEGDEVVVRRQDADTGWTDPLQILVWDRSHQEGAPWSWVVNVGPSDVAEVRLPLDSSYPTPLAPPAPRIRPPQTYVYTRVSLATFCDATGAQMRPLPPHLYAVAVLGADQLPFLYNACDYATFQDIAPVLDHLVDVAIHHRVFPVSAVVSSQDGYFEQTYHQPVRTYAPVYSDQRYVLAQSAQRHFPHTLLVPDRHYFYHNLYHSFRSFHRGIPFHLKRPQLVYGGQDRGTHHNFLVDRGIRVSPRQYFRQHVVPHHPWIHAPEGWMERRDQVHYKYVLDLDGIASTWDATAWKLNSGSVIFKTRSPWTQWFYDRYLPNVHYVEVADDFSDIEERFQWCEAHPEECLAMIGRCLSLFQEVYRYDHVVEHTASVLRTLRDAPRLPLRGIDYLDGLFYINLARRTDRRTHMEVSLTRMGLLARAERFDAIVPTYDADQDARARRFVAQGWYKSVEHTKGIVGCTRSHLAVFREAKRRGYPYTLILEDDFEWLVDQEEFYRRLDTLFVHDPLAFDVCMLSYKLVASQEVPGRADVVRVQEAQTASGYIVAHAYLDTLIALYETTLPHLETTGEHWHYANDQVWKVLQDQDRWYALTPRIGKQLNGFSDNACAEVNYDF